MAKKVHFNDLVTVREFSEFLVEYYENSHGLALGQALCSRFLASLDTKLFYQTNERLAVSRFVMLYMADTYSAL